MKNFLKAGFSVVIVILAANISGCAPTIVYSGARQVDAFSANDDKYQKWEYLIKEGRDFGIDFTDPVFSTLENPGAVKQRYCGSDNFENLKNKGSLRNLQVLFCLVEERLSSVTYSLIDQKKTPDEFVKEMSVGIADTLAHLKPPITGKVSVDKVKEENGINYYLIEVGDIYFTYRGFFFLETDKTKQLGVKMVISSADKSSISGSLDIVTKKAELLKSKVRWVE